MAEGPADTFRLFGGSSYYGAAHGSNIDEDANTKQDSGVSKKFPI